MSDDELFRLVDRPGCGGATTRGIEELPTTRGGTMALDIRAEHYSTADRLLLIAAGDALVTWARDVAAHEGEGGRWDRTPDDDAVLMAAELGALLTATTTMLQQALRWYRRASDNARRRAADEGQR